MTRERANPEKVAVALSGGVDSGVAALCLLEEGCDVTAVYLRLCDDVADPEPARGIADWLGIPFHVLDLRQEFEELVIRPFVRAYHQGLTPNPCVVCNPRIKLGLLLDWARSRGAASLATGHYARIRRNEASGRWELMRGLDPRKDQSYYLYGLNQDQLASFRCPLGSTTKDRTREIARERGLPVAQRGESQDICFIPDDDYRRFLGEREEREEAPGEGPIVDREGNVLGRHSGIHHYTIGQRRGLSIGGTPHPLYVAAFRPGDSAVIVGPAEALEGRALETETVVWGALAGLDAPREARVKIRYRTPAAPALLEPLESGLGVRVTFREPQRAITPGQSAVFYDENDEVVLGGAPIRRAVE